MASMTEAEVRAWMAAQGVSASVIDDEAAYIATNYADDDENPMQVLQGALGTYLQRTQSGGDRGSGGYNTYYDDPEIRTDYGTTPARSDSPAGATAPTSTPVYQPSTPAVIQATTGSPVLTALQTANAPLIAATQAAVQQQVQQQATTPIVDDDDDDGATGTPVFQTTTPSSPLVPVALAAMLGKLLGMF